MRSTLLTLLLALLVAVIGAERAALLRPAPVISEDQQFVTRATPEIATHEVSVLGAALVHQGTSAAPRRVQPQPAPLPFVLLSDLPSPFTPDEGARRAAADVDAFPRPPARTFSLPLLI